jgi:hypothetical protein
MGLFDSVTSAIGGLVGLGGGQGEYYQGGSLQNDGTVKLKNIVDAQSSANVKNIMKQMQEGKLSLAEAMSKTENAAEQAALASGPIGSTLVASEQLRTDPLTRGQFGEGGSLAQALSQEKELGSRGFSLQPEDYEAYGQASGNIARMFGQQEQSLAKALANRGLSAGGSGTAMAQFTGLQGSKSEQLGQMQRQIADDRMKSNLERLNSTRQYLTNLGGLGQQALGGIRDANIRGMGLMADTASSLSNNQRSDFSTQEQVNQASMTSKLANKEKSLGDAISGGIFSGTQAGVGALSGGMLGGIGGKKSGEAGASGGAGIDPAQVASLAMLASDKHLKKDIKEYNTNEFLDNLKSYEYNYIDEKFGKGKQVGVMAQDIEKTIPSAIVNTPEGKMISASVIGPILAAMSDMHKRIKELEGK